MNQDNRIDDYIKCQVQAVVDFVESTQYWTEISVNKVLMDCKVIQNTLNAVYHKQSQQALEESCRQILSQTFRGDLSLFIYYFNSFLYLEKIRQKVQDK